MATPFLETAVQRPQVLPTPKARFGHIRTCFLDLDAVASEFVVPDPSDVVPTEIGSLDIDVFSPERLFCASGFEAVSLTHSHFVLLGNVL